MIYACERLCMHACNSAREYARQKEKKLLKIWRARARVCCLRARVHVQERVCAVRVCVCARMAVRENDGYVNWNRSIYFCVVHLMKNTKKRWKNTERKRDTREQATCVKKWRTCTIVYPRGWNRKGASRGYEHIGVQGERTPCVRTRSRSFVREESQAFVACRLVFLPKNHGIIERVKQSFGRLVPRGLKTTKNLPQSFSEFLPVSLLSYLPLAASTNNDGTPWRILMATASASSLLLDPVSTPLRHLGDVIGLGSTKLFVATCSIFRVRRTFINCWQFTRVLWVSGKETCNIPVSFVENRYSYRCIFVDSHRNQKIRS